MVCVSILECKVQEGRTCHEIGLSLWDYSICECQLPLGQINANWIYETWLCLIETVS